MNATITYRMEYLPHPWNEKRRSRGTRAWCLVKVVTPAVGPKSAEPVAIFDWDSEAERFMGHVFALGLDGKLVTIDSDYKELFRLTGPKER